MIIQSLFALLLGSLLPSFMFAWVPSVQTHAHAPSLPSSSSIVKRTAASASSIRRTSFERRRSAIRYSYKNDKRCHDPFGINAKTWRDTFGSSSQAAIVSALLGGVLLTGPTPALSSPAGTVHAIAGDAPTSRPEKQIVLAAALPSPTVQANAIKDATLPKPDTLGTMNDDNKSIEPIFLNDKTQNPSPDSVVDEAWTLIDKYYIDRTFGGNDWNKVREKYKYLVNKANSDEARFKLVSEMVASLGDKYSRILNPQQYTAIQKYDLIGVGVTLMPDADKNIIVGAPPIAGSEAAKAGMQVGDFVTAINGIPTTGRTAFDIIDQISENPNAAAVSMTVRPKNSGADAPTREITMARSFMEVKDPIIYRLSETRPDGTKVGYVKIKEFNSLIKGSLEKALSDLEDQGANAYVIDIRQNTGGAFQSAVEISGLFMEDRVATYVVDNTEMRLPFRTTKGTLVVDREDPIVIWIDGRSASASEVFAGSLHDNCRAVLAGDRSFGKGLIQAVYGLKDGSGLVLTVARYVTPSGTDIQDVGITPDLGGKYLPFGPLGTGSDTSKINFEDIRNRLSENSCRAPSDIASSASAAKDAN